MKYKIIDHFECCGELFKKRCDGKSSPTRLVTLKEILEEINRDRSDEWTDYNRLDWREGLREWTEWELIEPRKTV